MQRRYVLNVLLAIFRIYLVLSADNHDYFQTVRVAYFAEGADADEARAAGADIVGGLELIEEIASNEHIYSIHGFIYLIIIDIYLQVYCL